jgi:hypothetical protein
MAFGVFGAMLPPSIVEAACAEWNASGEFTFVQTNGYRPKFTLRQTGSEIHGTAVYEGLYLGTVRVPVTASVDGNINGDAFEVTAYWNNDTTGVYSGHIGAQGRIEGSTYDKRHPDVMALWHSEPTIGCGPTALPGPGSPFPGPGGAFGLQERQGGLIQDGGGRAQSRYCDAYANGAVAAAKEGLQLECGFTGARWSADASGHLNWCLSLGGDHTLPSSEEAARAEGLGDCRARTARGQVITRPPRRNDSLFKMTPK